MQPEVADHCRAMGWQLKEKRGRKRSLWIVVKGDGPCGCGPQKASITSGGHWSCRKCGQEGFLIDRVRQVAGADSHTQAVEMPMTELDRLHDRLLDPEGQQAFDYWHLERRLSLFTIQAWKLGADKHGNPALPIRKPNGQLIGIKVRRMDTDESGAKYRVHPSGVNPPLFGSHRFDPSLRYAHLTEGEIDAVSLAQMGYKNVLGVPGQGVWPDGSDELLKDCQRIWLWFDPDLAGDAGVEVRAKHLGIHRCFRVPLPSDVNDMLGRYTAADFEHFQEHARQYESQSVRNLGDLRERFQKHLLRSEKEQLDLPWPKLNRLLVGLRLNELTIWTGGSGIGKTTSAVQVMVELSRAYVPCLILSCEMTPAAICAKMVRLDTGHAIDLPHVRNRGYVYTRPPISADDAMRAFDDLRERPLYVIDHYGAYSVDRIKEDVQYAVGRYGVQVVLIDHLHFFLPPPRRGQNYAEMVEEAARDLKALTMQLPIHLILICHPRKLDGARCGLQDIKGSSSLEQVCDNGIVLHASRGHTEIELQKVRDDFGQRGSSWFTFDRDSLRLQECATAPMRQAKKTTKSGRQLPDEEDE